MRKRNLLVIAMAWAAGVMLLLALPTGLDQTELAGILYFPAILIAVLLTSGAAHAPESAPMWVGAAAWSVSYWLLVLVIYAVLLEYYLMRAAIRQLGQAADATDSDDLPDGEGARHLHRFGRALGSLERRRRRHWLLAPIDGLDLTGSAQQIGADALHSAEGHRAVRSLLRHFERGERRLRGAESGRAALRSLRAQAARHTRRAPD